MLSIMKIINKIEEQFNKPEFKYMAKMNDTNSNRQGMKNLLSLGPNEDDTYSKWKTPWEEDELPPAFEDDEIEQPIRRFFYIP